MWQFKFRRTVTHAVADTALGSLNPCIDPMPNRAALHKDNGMVPVFSGDGCGQAQDIPRF